MMYLTCPNCKNNEHLNYIDLISEFNCTNCHLLVEYQYGYEYNCFEPTLLGINLVLPKKQTIGSSLKDNKIHFSPDYSLYESKIIDLQYDFSNSSKQDIVNFLFVILLELINNQHLS